MENVIEYWKDFLSLNHVEVKTEAIDPKSVTYPDDIEDKDKFFTGISIKATIHHDKPLTEEEVLHELLHLANPSKSEDWINFKTSELLKRK